MAQANLILIVKFPWWTSIYVWSVLMLGWLGFPVNLDKHAKRLVDHAVVPG